MDRMCSNDTIKEIYVNKIMYQMKKHLKWNVFILGMITLMSFQQQNKEQDFVNMAAIASKFEVSMAEQAVERSSNLAIKKYSQMLIDDHQKLANELQQYAGSKGLTFPAQLDVAHQAKIDSMLTIDARNYDQAYKAAAVASHQKSISLYQAATINSDLMDTMLKTWIADKIPVMTMHLDEIKNVRLTNLAKFKTKTQPTTDTTKMHKMH